ncbi:MAG: hypothetical protein HKP48_12065 [Winogradskyella sp.]|uniref:hypothetical protein n=1 Tax=Winogradskyella sp. TaxID=1883156 RepID=UPI0017E01A25|nr:hypothetical protein [Winogradskyella sp.]MBT8243704.1 hypothetical protein [Winogradskyella sp.]NNK23989.1 hypothetical protein [Winogradskyella sp.]
MIRVNYTNIIITINFLGEISFDTDGTVVVNQPPVIVDNLENVINSNPSFSGYVLTESSDPDGNFAPATFRLVDPSNPDNQGSVGTPLFITGVGTYTVDNTSNVIFAPETDYIGDASILV